MNQSTEAATKAQAETKKLNRCNEHRDCGVDYDGEWCPMCTSDNLLSDYERTAGRLRGEHNSLTDRVAELEKEVAELEEQLAASDDDSLCSAGVGRRTRGRSVERKSVRGLGERGRDRDSIRGWISPR